MSVFNAISIPFFGDSHVLRVEQYGLPALEKGEILVKVIAAGVNPIDCKTRAGLGWAAEQNKSRLPWVPGYDMAGIVAAVSDERLSHLVNKLVFGMIGFPLDGGAYSEYTKVLHDEIIPVAEHVSTSAAAGLPLAGLTAYQALVDHGELKASDKVLIVGATGGVGHLAGQIAQLLGADVFALGSEAKRDKILPIGEQWQWLDKDALAQNDFDLVIDCVGGEASIAMIDQIKSAKKWITLPSNTAEQVKLACLQKNISARHFLVSTNREQLRLLGQFLEEGKIQVHIDTIFPMADVANAHQMSEQGKAAGKLLLAFD